MSFLEVPVKHSMLISQGERWRVRRAAFRPHLTPSAAAAQSGVMSSYARTLRDRWLACADAGRAVEASGDLLALTIDVGATHLFGPAVTERERRALRLVAEAVPTFTDRNVSLPFLSHRLPLPWNRAMRSAMREVDTVVEAAVDAQFATGREGDDVLARATAADVPLDRGELRDELIGLLMAAFESSSVSLAWLVHLLAQYPEWQASVAAEARGSLERQSADTEGPGGDRLTGDGLDALPVTRQVVEEVLRIYPAFPLIPRMAATDTNVQGTPVPSGSYVVVSPWVTHRRPDLWADPERFDPERFAPGVATSRPAGAYFPFGEGPRNCVGRHLGLSSLVLCAATLLEQLELAPQPGHPDPVPTGMPIRPRGGVWIRVARRS